MVVKTHGILMSGEMIRAYQACLKSQTRRLKNLKEINESPNDWGLVGFPGYIHDDGRKGILFGNTKTNETKFITLPYGYVGDSLYFKETYALICKNIDCEYHDGETEVKEDILFYHDLQYRADSGDPYPGDWPAEEARGNPDAPKWQSSMFMAQKYSRFTNIPVLKVRLERLKDITEADAQAEGVTCPPPKTFIHSASYREEYMKLWDKLNGKKLPWRVNPWVWVYEFPVFAPPVKKDGPVHIINVGGGSFRMDNEI